MRHYLIGLLLLGIIALSIVSSSAVVADSGNFNSTSADAGSWCYNTSDNYSAIWNATTCDFYPSSNNLMVGQQDYCDSSEIHIWRSMLYFDTSSIPSLATITSAMLYLYLYDDWSYTDFNVTIQNGQPIYPHLPVISTDFNRFYYSGDGGSINTSGLSEYTFFNITLNASGISWINKDSYTKLVLRSSRDIAGIRPANTTCWNSSGLESIWILPNGSWNYECPSQNCIPYLSLTWQASAPPIVTTLPATYVTMTSARISGRLDSDGGAGTLVYAAVGPNPSDPDWGSCPEYNLQPDLFAWYLLGTYHTGETFYVDITGLCPNDSTDFAFQANNGYIVQSALLNFVTSTSCGNITDIEADPSACAINLTWTKPIGCGNTIIRYQTGSCPTDNSSGTEIYNGSSNYFSHTGLTAGTTYRYIFYGYSGGYWGNISDCVIATTLAGSCAGHVPISSDTDTTSWFSWTNSSRMDNFFLTPMINGIADDFGMPHNTMWFFLSIFFIVVSAFIWYLASSNLIWCGIWIIVCLATFGFYQMLPLWLCVIFGVAALGIGVKGASS